jgi:hypothetical protein
MLSMSYRLTIGVLSFFVQVVNIFRIKSYKYIYRNAVKTVNIHEAKTHLSRLVDEAAKRNVFICRGPYHGKAFLAIGEHRVHFSRNSGGWYV